MRFKKCFILIILDSKLLPYLSFHSTSPNNLRIVTLRDQKKKSGGLVNFKHFP